MSIIILAPSLFLELHSTPLKLIVLTSVNIIFENFKLPLITKKNPSTVIPQSSPFFMAATSFSHLSLCPIITITIIFFPLQPFPSQPTSYHPTTPSFLHPPSPSLGVCFSLPHLQPFISSTRITGKI